MDQPVEPQLPKVRRGRRRLVDGPALTREQLVDALLNLVERKGLAAVNMRQVALDLGVSHRLIYHHVRDKDEMIDLLSDAITARGRADLAGLDWRQRVMAIATATRRAFCRYPGMAYWAMARSTHNLKSPASAEVRRELRQAIADSGLTPVQAEHAYLAFSALTLGHLVESQSSSAAGDADQGGLGLAVDEAQLEASFQTALDIYLRGVESLVAENRRAADGK